MIRPHLEYSDFLIDSANQACIDKVEGLQERIFRVIEYQSLSINCKEISNLKTSLSIENLSVRHKRSLLRLMYIQRVNVDNVQEIKMNMTLRSSRKVKLKSDFTRLTIIQRSLYYRGLCLWNSLPEKTQKETSSTKFKENVKL